MKSLVTLLLFACGLSAAPPKIEDSDFYKSAKAGIGKEQAPQPKTEVQLPAIDIPPQLITSGTTTTTGGEKKRLLLTKDFQYKFQSDEKVSVTIIPEGIAKWTMEEGPIKEKGFWADLPDAKEKSTKRFDKKYVYELTPIGVGEITLLVIPYGFKDDKEINMRTIDVMKRGPPSPTPDDDIHPTDIKTFRAIFVKESGTNLSPAQSAIPGAKAIREYLDAKTTKEGNTTGWREYDPQQVTTNEQPTMKALWEAAKSKITTIPCVIAETNGKVEIIPWPKDVADGLETLKKYGGK